MKTHPFYLLVIAVAGVGGVAAPISGLPDRRRHHLLRRRGFLSQASNSISCSAPSLSIQMR